jgi:hypothetical protein
LGFKYPCFAKKEILTVFKSSYKVGKVWGFGIQKLFFANET